MSQGRGQVRTPTCAAQLENESQNNNTIKINGLIFLHKIYSLNVNAFPLCVPAGFPKGLFTPFAQKLWIKKRSPGWGPGRGVSLASEPALSYLSYRVSANAPTCCGKSASGQVSPGFYFRKAILR
jgi:hypothetical protein